MLQMLLTSKLQIPYLILLFLETVMQIVGYAITSLIPLNTGAGRYRSEVLMGTGLGLTFGVLGEAFPQLIGGRDQGMFVESLRIGLIFEY